MAKSTDPAVTPTTGATKPRSRRRSNAEAGAPTKVAANRARGPEKAAATAPDARETPATAVAQSSATAAETHASPGHRAPGDAVSAPPPDAPVAAERPVPPVAPVAAPPVPAAPIEPASKRRAGADNRVVAPMAVASGRAALAAAMRTQQFAGEQMSRACATTRAMATCGSLPAGLALQTQYLADSAQSGMAYVIELAQLANDFWRPSKGR